MSDKHGLTSTLIFQGYDICYNYPKNCTSGHGLVSPWFSISSVITELKQLKFVFFFLNQLYPCLVDVGVGLWLIPMWETLVSRSNHMRGKDNSPNVLPRKCVMLRSTQWDQYGANNITTSYFYCCHFCSQAMHSVSTITTSGSSSQFHIEQLQAGRH